MSLLRLFVSVFVGTLGVVIGWYFISPTPEHHSNRFSSFAPVWESCEAKWYVDGQDYMAGVTDAIEAASKEIFITDWQISPHIFMKRPVTGVDSSRWRLDKMLLRKSIYFCTGNQKISRNGPWK